MKHKNYFKGPKENNYKVTFRLLTNYYYSHIQSERTHIQNEKSSNVH